MPPPDNKSVDGENKDEAGGKGRGRGKPKEEPVSSGSSRRCLPSAEELQKAAKSKLSLVTHLTNRVFAVGGKIKLTCVVQGPDPNVKWFKNEQPLTYSPRVRNMSRDGLCVLEINPCNLEDGGDYTLVVRNTESDVTTQCRIQVYDPQGSADLVPTFTRSLKGALFKAFILPLLKCNCEF